jgi:hypothetical protein
MGDIALTSPPKKPSSRSTEDPSGKLPVKNQSADTRSSMQDVLSKVSRYEALFELTGVINAATDIESVGEVLARRLKYIVDVYSWRYVCFDGDPEETAGPEPTAIVVDGNRGRVDVMRTVPSALSSLEVDLWRDRRTRILCGDSMTHALEQLPARFQKDDLEQISVNSLVENGKTQALYLFCKRRQPFTELDIRTRHKRPDGRIRRPSQGGLLQHPGGVAGRP